MARQGEDFGREQSNQLLREVSHTIAEEMGLDELPMANENFDFFGRGLNILRGLGKLSREDPEHATAMAIQRMVLKTPRLEKGQTEYTAEQLDKKNLRGAIYGYPKYLAEQNLTPERWPFDRYFAMIFKQKALTELTKHRGTGKGRTKKHISIAPGLSEEQTIPGYELSEERVERGTPLGSPTPTPPAELSRREEQHFLDEILPDLLAKERNAKPLLLFYDMHIRGGVKKTEVRKRLNELADINSDYWPEGSGVTTEGKKVPWADSTVDRYADTIKKIAERYLRQQAQQRAQKKHPRAITPEESRAIFQSRHTVLPTKGAEETPTDDYS